MFKVNNRMFHRISTNSQNKILLEDLRKSTETMVQCVFATSIFVQPVSLGRIHYPLKI